MAKQCFMVCSVAQPCLTATLWSAACRASLSSGFLQARIPECSQVLPCPPPGDLPTPGSNPGLPHCSQILYQLSHEGSPIFQGTCIQNLHPLPCRWTLGLLSCLGYCKQCYNEHWGACILAHHVLLRIYAPEWDGRIMCRAVLSCFSRVQLFVTLWTIDDQASLPMGFSRQDTRFSRQDTRVGCQALLQEMFLTHGSNLSLLRLLHWHFTTSGTWQVIAGSHGSSIFSF